MDQNLNKVEIKDKLISIFNANKAIIYSITVILVIILLSISYFKINYEKENNLIAEKYIKAGLYLAEVDKEKSKILYEEILLSKNKFYSVLALNTILENNLVNDKNKILEYFRTIEQLKISKEQQDLIKIKKALYLIKNSNTKNGNELLNNLIEENSKFKFLAEEILVK
tara:strand:- start:318 stop:824 length:507 start_codon:yes stop_codon:yes gene_type:complete